MSWDGAESCGFDVSLLREQNWGTGGGTAPCAQSVFSMETRTYVAGSSPISPKRNAQAFERSEAFVLGARQSL